MSTNSHLIVTVHGIRTYGHWQERLERLVKKDPSDRDVEFINYKFGYFSAISFAIPFLRWWLVRRFRTDLVRLCNINPRTRIDLVGHSFGTYVIARAIATLPPDTKITINTIILSGSVLPSTFPWHEYIGSRVVRVINDCGSKDYVLLISQFFVLFTGMAGRIGFNGAMGEKFRNRYSPFGHRGYFLDGAGKPNDDYLRKHWVPLLTSEDPAPVFDSRAKPTGFDLSVEKLATHAGLIKLAIYLTPFIGLWLVYSNLYLQAETARVVAEIARMQEETARKEAGAARVQAANDLLADDPDRALLLALEAFPDQSRGSDRPIIAGARLTLEKAIRASKELARLVHAGRVTSISFSPNGQWLATSSLDGLTQIFDVKTGAIVTQSAHDGQVNRVRFSPDSRLIATASSDKTARLWDVATGKQIARLVHDGWGVLDIAFSPDGKLLATASGQSGDWRTKAYARVWDVTTATELLRSPHDDDVQSVEFSADGRLLLTRSGKEYAPGEARVTEISTGKELIRRTHNSSAILSAVFSPDGKSFASASNDQTARIWNIATGDELVKLPHDGPVRTVRFSPNGRILATETGGGPWDKKGEARLSDATTGKTIVRIASTEDITELAFSPDGRLLATGSRDEVVRVWDVETGAEIRKFPHSGEVRSITFSPDGRILATGSYDNRTRVLATASNISGPEYVSGLAQLWKVAEELDFPELVTAGWLSSATFSPDARLIATSSGGPGPFQGEARLWDTNTNMTVARLSHGDQVSRAVFSPDGNLLATAAIKGSYLWRVGTGTLLRQLPHNGPLLFSPDSQVIVTSTTHAAQLWAIGSGNKISDLPHDRQVRSAVYNRDGSVLATAAGNDGSEGYRGEARLWDPRTGKLAFVLKHRESVCCVDFSPNGSLLATASNDQKARIWNARTGEEQFQFSHDSDVTDVAFSPNGRVLASASDNVVYIWDAATGRKLASLLHDRSKSSARYRIPSKALRSNGRPYGNVRAMAFSPDGLFLATAAGEVTRLWEVDTGNELAQYSRRLEGEINSIAFSRDGMILMAASESGNVSRWRVFTTTQSLVDFARSRVARCLTPAERRQYSLADRPPQWCIERNLWPYLSQHTVPESTTPRALPGWLTIGTDQ
ncbi:WD40 repeat [Bradyrhizobium sp. NFR13]|uniref:WD40 repeat domain-containing protein n=1 Tax=Bradyrhizobium sp. NFR13 TaxID=1566285 RepID=UPI0008E9BC1E|nr:PQQ-binding-like beta-propeller repeat protein [Bradyrhizobium sp. NFR13]SFM08768.1 WD40 repeat [Bradyrhizobium sp. NFR13]